MENLVAICGVAFLVVFGLLSLLAILMVAITALFPQGEIPAQPKNNRSASTSDPAVIAAVTAAVSALVPGAHVTHMEEDR